MAKAIAAGASAATGGSMLVGTEESPGEIELYQGRLTDLTRGMGSRARCPKVPDRYFQSDNAADKLVPEGDRRSRSLQQGRLKVLFTSRWAAGAPVWA
ncbi:IMP dehydrogenase [Escherichia coli]